MPITIEAQALAPWLALLVSGAAFFYAIRKDKSAETKLQFEQIETRIETKASKDHVAVLAGKLDIAEDKITRIDVELEHMPDRNTVLELAREVAKLSGDVGVLAERVKPIASMADRMQEAMMEKVMSS